MNCEQNDHFDGKIKKTIQINDLPIEVLVIIFSVLDIKSLCTIERGSYVKRDVMLIQITMSKTLIFGIFV